MNYTDKLKKENKYLTFLFLLLLLLNIIMLYVVIDIYSNNMYLSKELDKTNAEKTLLIQKLEPYESAEGKH